MSAKADQWIMANAENFKPEHFSSVKQRVSQMSDDKIDMLLTAKFHKPMTMLIIAIVVGEFGVDRFMLGQTGLGIAKLLTFGGCLIWWIIDMFLIMDATRNSNYEKFLQATGQLAPSPAQSLQG